MQLAFPGSSRLMLIPTSVKRGSPSKRVNRPKIGCSNHWASRALTTNQPSPVGLRPPGCSSSFASGTICAPLRRVLEQRRLGAPMARRHLIGLLLATEADWPAAFEAVIERVGSVRWRGETHELATERITNEPFDLRDTPHYSVVIDRLSWWYDLPREWLKKVALMDDIYLLNNPFTFQAMEK